MVRQTVVCAEDIGGGPSIANFSTASASCPVIALQADAALEGHYALF